MSLTGSPFDLAGIARDARGCARYLDRPDSLVALLRRTVDRLPGAEAVSEVGGRSLTYQDLWDMSAETAGGLLDSGVVRGDRVVLRLADGVSWFVAFFATQLAGAVAVPIGAALPETQAAAILEDSGASFCFDTDRRLPVGSPVAVEDLAPDDLAAIFYTADDAGALRGAMTTHANLTSSTETVRRILGFPHDAQGVRSFATSPLSTPTACHSQFLPMCELGGTTVVLPELTPETFVRAIEAERISLLVDSPAGYRLALNHPTFARISTSSVRWAVYGAAPAPPDLLDLMVESFPSALVERGFGPAEATSVATYLPHRYAREQPDSVGFAAPIVDLMLSGLDPQTGVGELLMRGANVVPGYWNQPEATAETFVDGWVRTGDLARIDDQGLTYLVDRLYDVIHPGGDAVYCNEIETVLACHPGVLEVAAVGVPDQALGERVGVVVVPLPGSRLDVSEVVKAARDRLADHQLPQYAALRDAPLPRSLDGRIRKSQLRATTVWERVPNG